MRKYDGQLSTDADILNQYLNQYKNCICKKHSLENRRQEIVKEFDNPLRGIHYDGMPKENGEGIGCAALCFRLDEIDTRIREQIDIATKALSDIMDVIEFLPENSMERSILEHKYIDRYSWAQICQIEHISRTPATRHWRKGLYRLLGFKKVNAILHDYEKQLGGA